MVEAVMISEFCLRDKLQDERNMITAGNESWLVDMLTNSRIRKNVVTRFVSPKCAPRLAGAAAAMAEVQCMRGVKNASPTLNCRGLGAVKDVGLLVLGYVSCINACPYDGPTLPESVARVAKTKFNPNCCGVSLSGSIGAGTLDPIKRMLNAVLAVNLGDRLAGHHHDTGA